MLLNIVICEDNDELRNYYQLIIKNYIKERPTIEMKIILSTANPKDVNIYLESHSDDLTFYLLDIEFPDSKIKGIDLATQIRKCDLESKIVFITTHEELMTMIFDRKVEPLDYIAKENGIKVIEERLNKDLDIAIKRLEPSSKQAEAEFKFYIGQRLYKFNLNKIDYFESSENTHNVFLHSENEIIEFPSSLKSIGNQYKGFYRAHKSLLVNLNNIASLDNHDFKINFKDGTASDISRRKLVLLRKHCSQQI